MLKRKIFVFILLSSLFLSFYPVQAQIVHEDPGSLPVHEPYDADRKLALALEAMFGSLDSFAAHVSASDFTASRRDILLFSLSHANFTEVYRKAGLSGSDMGAIAEKLASMPDDLRAMLNSSEAYSVELGQYANYTSAGDMANAVRLAARMQASYMNVSESSGRLGSNSTSILRMLGNSSVDTTGLENGIVGMNSYRAKVNESNRNPSGLLGDTSLSLTASSREALTGDFITLTAALRIASGVPAGRLVRFFVDDGLAGSAITDASGVCTIVYKVDGRSFKRTMRAQAELDPQGESLFPASSNVVEFSRQPERSSLQVRATPDVASYAATINVYGMLTTLYGVPAAGQTVTITMAGAPVGNVTTGSDGSYTFPLAIPYDAPAGETIIQSGYASAPDSALSSALSYPCVVKISPDATLVTFERPQPVVRGGEIVAFGGTLSSGDGRPVTGADVGIFADDVLIGTGRTDAGGRFSLAAPVPYNITPGDRDVYASFSPGEGRALAGAKSEAFPTRFEPAAPKATVHGLPLLTFPGDELNLAGVLMTGDGRPLDGRQITVGVAGTVTTDAGGSYQISWKVAGGPGVYPLTISVPASGLLAKADYPAGIVLVMPFDKTGTALAIIVLLLAAGLVIVKVTGRRSGHRRKQPPRPVALQARPEPGNGSTAFSFEEELKTIDQAIYGGSDRREAVRSIYLAAKRMLRDREPTLPDSVTHRELCRLLAGRQPLLSGPLEVITTSYEGAVFGHYPPTDEEVYGSLYSLGELRKLLYGVSS